MIWRMRAFAALYEALDASTSTAAKVEALAAWLRAAEASDAAWAVYFLAGGKPRQVVPTAVLRAAACEAAGLDDWLFEAAYQAVGDLAETIAHVLPPPSRRSDEGLAYWVERRLLPLRGQPPQDQALAVRQAWDELDVAGRFLLIKLIGGGFRVGVSRLLVQRAVAQAAGLDEPLVAQRMMGWTDGRTAPDAARWAQLISPDRAAGVDEGQPYPFFLAHPLPGPPEALGAPADWLVEWKYDGIRAQLVRRAGRTWLWSRGEELVTDRFPEVEAAGTSLPEGTVLDGEVLVWHAGRDRPEPFTVLQRRIGRKAVTRRTLAEAPVCFIAYDLLEHGGVDLRNQPQAARRAALEALLQGDGTGCRVSPRVEAADWKAYAALRDTARERRVEGFMLKHRLARYGVGRRKAVEASLESLSEADPPAAAASWWKWKVDPLRVDAVLIYAQAGHGRRAGVYTDYTFAVWNRVPAGPAEAQAVVEAIARREPPAADGLQLVSFAKAYSGLTDAEFARVDRAIRATTLEKFGPVRSVRPTLVFELGFEGLNASARHRSGIAVRFPRMLRIRDDKPLHEADTLDTLRALMDATPGP
jgi:DNA ligase-1